MPAKQTNRISVLNHLHHHHFHLHHRHDQHQARARTQRHIDWLAGYTGLTCRIQRLLYALKLTQVISPSVWPTCNLTRRLAVGLLRHGHHIKNSPLLSTPPPEPCRRPRLATTRSSVCRLNHDDDRPQMCSPVRALEANSRPSSRSAATKGAEAACELRLLDEASSTSTAYGTNNSIRSTETDPTPCHDHAITGKDPSAATHICDRDCQVCPVRP